MNIIDVQNLNYKIDKNVILKDINLTLSQNKLYSIIGPNGSGKTTLLKLMLGLLKPMCGNVVVKGQNIKALNSLEKSKLISYVPQNTQVEFEFTTEEVVLMGRNPYKNMFGRINREDRILCDKSMNLTNIFHLKDRDISTLSGGERQRAIISRALCQNTDIIFLDEPISQLDIHHQVQIMKLLKSLVINEGKTIIVVIHDLNLASSYSDEIILMNNGEIVKKGKNNEVMKNDMLEKVYPTKFYIMDNPVDNSPLILTYNGI